MACGVALLSLGLLLGCTGGGGTPDNPKPASAPGLSISGEAQIGVVMGG